MSSEYHISSTFQLLLCILCTISCCNRAVSQIPQCISYPTIHHSEHRHAHFCSEWCIVGKRTGTLWNLLMHQPYFNSLWLVNQCWLIIWEVLWHSPEGNLTGNAQDIYPWYEFENYWSKDYNSIPRGQWVNPPNASYMHQWIGSALVQIMACPLFSTKPLSEPVLGYCQVNP